MFDAAKLFTEAFNAVAEINQEFYDENDWSQFLVISSDSYDMAIRFLGIELWSTNDETRSYDELKDEYEPFESCLCREANKVLDRVRHIMRLKWRTA